MNQIELPASRPATDMRLPYRETNPRQRILVVDDEAPMRCLNAEVLICYGYAVDTAVDGADAWDALQIHSYDLLITDNGMPKVTGIQLLEKLHDSGLEVPTIMATGIAPVEEFARSPWLEPVVLLLKPYTCDELLGAVQNILHQATIAHGEIAPPPNWPIPQPVRISRR